MHQFGIEPKRDWSWGPITGHRVFVVGVMVFGMATLELVQSVVWPAATPHGVWQQMWSWGALVWVAGAIPGGIGLVGLIAFRHPAATEFDRVRPIKRLVSWRIVSRGTNVQALTDTIRRCQEEMSRTPLFPYVIEVVVDDAKNPALPPAGADIQYLVVPRDYQTPRGSRYKARALQYALTHSLIPANAWIVHLDEETQPTSSGIKGICRMIRHAELTGDLRFGQGAILYHRKWRQFPLLTLADNVRTGDDFARFYVEHQLGVTLFGLHGSYIVVRNDMEQSVGFDFGPQGSITEDAFWALVAMQRGYRCAWVDGYLEEQSTQSVTDFIKQRRRWFQGLMKVTAHAPVKLRWRLALGLNTILWAIAPFALLYTLAHLVSGAPLAWWIRYLANFSFMTFFILYLVGLRTNLDEHGVNVWWKRLGWYAAQIVLQPVFSVMENLGVLSAIVKPVGGFHVVKK